MSVRLDQPDRPWMMRTYAGHSTAAKSNELYRRNLAKGQTGLSVAFDLPTQTGYDADHELARGEVGKVGVPIAHRGDMSQLMDGIPLDKMNTSMTINATAAWLLALYVVAAEDPDANAQRRKTPIRASASSAMTGPTRKCRLPASIGTLTSRSRCGRSARTSVRVCHRGGRAVATDE